MRTVDTQEFQKLTESDDNVTIVNVLPREKFEERHIPGSVSIPLQEPNFEDRVEEAAGGKSATVVVYCANEDCDASPKAAEKLEEAGFEDVIDFTGGTAAWNEAGLEVETAA